MNRLLPILALLLSTATFAGGSRRVAVTREVPADLLCESGGQRRLAFTFPVDGGPITGATYSATLIRHEGGEEALATGDGLYDDGNGGLRSDLPPELAGTCQSVQVAGTFEAGDVGMGSSYDLTLRFRVRGDDASEAVRTWQGTLPPEGEGTLRVEGELWKLTYPPYQRSCTPNLEAYDAKLQDKITEMLRDEALKATKAFFDAQGQKLWSKVHAKLLRVQIDGSRHGARIQKALTGKAAPANSMIERIARKLFPDSAGKVPGLKLLDEAIAALGPTLDTLETSAAILDGDTLFTAYKAATTAVGVYSNVAGLAVMFGEAAHADWQRFTAGSYQKQFRLFYEHHYTKGGHPDAAHTRRTRKERLKHFMEDMMIFLKEGGAMGGGGAPQFRKMLGDYASRNLQRTDVEIGRPWQSGDDFAVEERGGRYRFRNNHAGSILVLLFKDFEKVYASDLHAHQMARIARAEKKVLGRILRRVEDQVAAAQDGHFNQAWRTQAAYEKAFCTIIAHLESKGLKMTR